MGQGSWFMGAAGDAALFVFSGGGTGLPRRLSLPRNDGGGVVSLRALAKQSRCEGLSGFDLFVGGSWIAATAVASSQ